MMKLHIYLAGYFNTTRHGNIKIGQFKMASAGNIDSGTITLYGIN